MGLNEKLKSACIYWPKKCNITVEQNIYFDNSGPAEHLRREDYELVKVSTIPTLTDNSTSEIVEPPKAPTTEPIISDTHHEQWICKPSQRIQDLINGQAVQSNHPSDLTLAQGPTLPVVVEWSELEGEHQSS